MKDNLKRGIMKNRKAAVICETRVEHHKKRTMVMVNGHQT